MKNNFTTQDGREIELTPEEMKFLNALNRLNKMNPGNIYLFANGTLSARYGGFGSQNEFSSFPNIKADGGDGGDFIP